MATQTPPCCVANIADPNANTANFDNSMVVHNKSGTQLVTAVSNFYAAAGNITTINGQQVANSQIRPNAPPIFKTYQQMMDWKQSQNRR
jgi:hypothetical protein